MKFKPYFALKDHNEYKSFKAKEKFVDNMVTHCKYLIHLSFAIFISTLIFNPEKLSFLLQLFMFFGVFEGIFVKEHYLKMNELKNTPFQKSDPFKDNEI